MISRFFFVSAALTSATSAACGGGSGVTPEDGSGQTAGSTGAETASGSGGSTATGGMGGTSGSLTTASAGGTGGSLTGAGGGGCNQDGDCAANQECSYVIAEGCGAKGTCVDMPKSSPCGAIVSKTGCGCDGQDVHWILGCSPSQPNGYAPAPIASENACPTAVDCQTSADCAAGQDCGFLIADGCAGVGHCVTASDLMPLCKALTIGCTCDAMTVEVPCGSNYALEPIAHPGGC